MERTEALGSPQMRSRVDVGDLRETRGNKKNLTPTRFNAAGRYPCIGRSKVKKQPSISKLAGATSELQGDWGLRKGFGGEGGPFVISKMESDTMSEGVSGEAIRFGV